MSDSEDISYFCKWRPPPIKSIANSFLGPFLVFLLLQGMSKVTNLSWDNGSWGAAVVIIFSIPKTSASIPRHVILGQLLSGLVSFAFRYALPDPSVTYLRVALSVSVSAMLMKSLGISYPPGGATAYILSKDLSTAKSVGAMFFYLVFPLLVGSVILIIFAIVLDNLLGTEKYPRIWL